MEELKKKFDEALEAWEKVAGQYKEAAELEDGKVIEMWFDGVSGTIKISKKELMAILGTKMKCLESECIDLCRKMIQRPSEKKVIKF